MISQRDAYQALYQVTKRATSRHHRDLTSHPSPDEIRNARLAVNLTQEKAGAIVYTTAAHWSNWERDISKMPKASWRLFRLLTDIETL